jgi:hypothetical protein
MFTYKEIVDLFKQAAFDHLMIEDFGYGALSDIKTRNQSSNNDEEVNYPYAFLNPTTHQRTQGMVTYGFNLIMMDMAREELSEGHKQYDNFLAIQSQCQQYIDDMVAHLWALDGRQDIQFTMTYTPFVERFEDEVAGMTAAITIQVPISINDCIAPYPGTTTTTTAPPTTTTTTQAPPSVWGEVELEDQTRDPDPSGISITSITPPTVDTLNRWENNPNGGTPYSAFYVPDGGVTLTITMTGTAEQTPPGPGEVVVQTPPLINPHEIVGSAPTTNFDATLVSTNWPTTYQAGQFNWTATYEAVLPQSTGNAWSMNQILRGDQAQNESSIRLITTTIEYSG